MNEIISGFTPNLRQSGVVTRYELEKHFKSKGFIGIVVVILLILTLMTAVKPLLGVDFPTDPVEFVSDYVNWITIIVLIGAVAFASGSIVSEFEKRTGLLMFPQPVKRITYLLGKFVSTMIIVTAALALYYLIVAVLCLGIVGSVPSTMLPSFGFAVLYGFAVCGVAYLLSSILKTSTGAIVATVLLFLMVMPILDPLFSMAGVDPFFLASNASGAIMYSLETPYPETYTMMMPGGGEVTSYIPTQLTAALVLVSYGLAGLIASVFVFKKRQM